MERKTLKFREYLVKPILTGEKYVTFRLFDEKNLSVGDEIDLINWNTKEKFGEVVIINIREKKISELDKTDFVGHEKLVSMEDTYNKYRAYYGDKVDENTIVKIVHFKLNQPRPRLVSGTRPKVPRFPLKPRF